MVRSVMEGGSSSRTHLYWEAEKASQEVDEVGEEHIRAATTSQCWRTAVKKRRGGTVVDVVGGHQIWVLLQSAWESKEGNLRLKREKKNI